MAEDQSIDRVLSRSREYRLIGSLIHTIFLPLTLYMNTIYYTIAYFMGLGFFAPSSPRISSLE